MLVDAHLLQGNLVSQGFTPRNQPYAKAQLVTAFQTALGVQPYLNCGSGSSSQILEEVRCKEKSIHQVFLDAVGKYKLPWQLPTLSCISLCIIQEGKYVSRGGRCSAGVALLQLEASGGGLQRRRGLSI